MLTYLKFSAAKKCYKKYKKEISFPEKFSEEMKVSVE